MELLKTARRRSVWSEIIYVLLNILLAITILIAVLATTTPWLAFGLILLSKWRVLAVRSRYWMANIRANMVDMIVGFSVVVFLNAAQGDLVIQIALTALYIGWLLFIKPRSKRSIVALQALIGVLFGIGAIMQLSPSWPASLVVILSWLVGYSAARHIMSVQHESHINFLSLLWGFVVAEIAWLTYHWTISYTVAGNLQLAQSTIIIVALSFLAERIYMSYHHHQQIRMNDIILPALLSLSVIAVVVFVFGRAASI